MQQDFVTVWNIHGLDEADVQLANRTSNGLESYNCWMNNKVFPCAHPAVAIFVEYLKIETERVRDRIEDVRKGREDPPKHKEVRFPPVPEEYESCRSYAKSPRKKKTKKKAAKKNEKTENATKKKATRVNPPRATRKGKFHVDISLLLVFNDSLTPPFHMC